MISSYPFVVSFDALSCMRRGMRFAGEAKFSPIHRGWFWGDFPLHLSDIQLAVQIP